MKKILKVNRPSIYSSWLGNTDLHPLVSVIDYKKVSPIRHSLNNYDVYGIFLRDDGEEINLKYGCGQYEYKKGTLICVAPGQIGGKEDNEETVNISGWALLFHPDLLHGYQLEKDIKGYSFFDYRVNEALQMTEEERKIIVAIMRRISDEIYNNPRDDSQDSIIVSLIGLMLNYCNRYYNRQFKSHKTTNIDILSFVEQKIKDHFGNDVQRKRGLPSLQLLAAELCISVNYLGSLIKKKSGFTAGNYIRRIIVQEAKNRLVSGLSVSETAYDLGFDYPQHFSRMFKNITGSSPYDFIKSRTLGHYTQSNV